MTQSVGITAARTNAAFGDLRDRTRIELTGADAVKFLNNLVTNDIARLAPGTGCECFLCNAKGGMVDYVRAYRAEDRLWLDAAPGRADSLLKHLDRYLIREKVVLRNLHGDIGAIAILGPNAESVLTELGLAIPPAAPHSFCAGTYSGSPVTAVRSALYSASGFELLAAPTAVEGLHAALAARNVAALVPDDLHRLRVVAGVPEFGVDLVEGNIPQEADRAAATISFTKGCYIGQETVARLDAYGHVNKILRGVVFPPHAKLATGQSLWFNQKEVGKLGSVAASLEGDATLALAVLRTAAATPGTEIFTGETPETGPGVPGRVVHLPFTPPAGT
ncbi:MAG TPA: hypothetical protein VNC50_09325 [Planctomycetia bacterium]|nr:hypothetical protein [Planctomycetia bacterium]